MSFSKGIFIAILILTVAVVIYSGIMMWQLNNLDPLAYLIPAVFAECAVVSGFYSYKAKAENELKLTMQKQLIMDLLNEINQVKEPSDGYGAPDD